MVVVADNKDIYNYFDNIDIDKTERMYNYFERYEMI